jgi:uncharacterized membrane protein YphA (DoxX/SURF4 family)
VGLLLLRTAIGIPLLTQGVLCLAAQDAWRGLAALLAGALLTIGLLTPVAAVLTAVAAIAFLVLSVPACMDNLFQSHLSIVFASANLASLILLGPGSFSVDARIFGRREIIIPSTSSRS